MVTDKLVFEIATLQDLDSIVELLADDVLGGQRECYQTPLSDSYHKAFQAIDGDSNNELVIARLEKNIVAVLQLTYIPYLTHQGSWRVLIEGVRVAKEYRGQGLGRRFLLWAIDRARDRGCRIIQLTTDKSRPEALGFYQSLGFVASHEGMKLHLN